MSVHGTVIRGFLRNTGTTCSSGYMYMIVCEPDGAVLVLVVSALYNCLERIKIDENAGSPPPAYAYGHTQL